MRRGEKRELFFNSYMYSLLRKTLEKLINIFDFNATFKNIKKNFKTIEKLEKM